MTTTTSKSLILDSDDLSNIEKIQLTSLNTSLQTFIHKVHVGDHVDGGLEHFNIMETEEYKALVAELRSETQKYIKLMGKKLELELREKTAEENLEKENKVTQVVISKETVNEKKINTLKEENEFLYKSYKQAVTELQQQMQESEDKINKYKSSLMEELKKLKKEYESATAMDVQRYKAENKILKERMNKMVEQNNQIIQINSKFEAFIIKLEQEIHSNKEKIKFFESRSNQQQNYRIDVDQEITKYRSLLQKGFMRIQITPPDSLEKTFPGAEHEGKIKYIID